MERYKICKGKPLKIKNLNIKHDSLTGKTTWKFSVPMCNKGGAFEFIHIKVDGRCPYQEGDKVRVSEVVSYHSMLVYGLNGGRQIFRAVECKVEPYKKEEYDTEEEDY